MKVGYVGKAVVEANMHTQCAAKDVVSRPKDVTPDMDMVLSRYEMAKEQGDEVAMGIWFDAYCELTAREG